MSTTVEQSLERLESHRASIMVGDGKVAPGQPTEFTGAEADGDARAQGDLNLIWRESPEPPEGFVRRTNGDVQLVPGNTSGAKHCLDSGSAAIVFDPPGYGPEYEGLAGPFLVAQREVTVLHPTHGNVTIPEGASIECRYQRNLDEETQRERRAMD